MFQTDWYDGTSQMQDFDSRDILSYDLNKVDQVQFTFWAEHCLECAPPECYKSCEYYKKRVDGRCKRTEHGQEEYNLDNTILGKAMIIKFRPWAKIETYIYDRYLSVDEYRREENKYSRRIEKIRKLGSFNIKGLLNSAGYFFETRTKYRTQSMPVKTTSFLFETYSFMDKPYKMMIEAADIEWRVIARTAVIISPGFNSDLLDYRTIAPESTNVVRFYPENSIEAKIMVINAEFIVTKDTAPKIPAKNVKCVAWDLDNTLWHGILSETNQPELLSLRDGVKELIDNLDQRGVIQTIVSKNDYESAWKKIESFGLSEYFLYPAINWGQKSENLIAIAKELNINIDTFAVIDDSDFERREISASLPQVRVYPETMIMDILKLPEFDLPITDEAKLRRGMYQIEAKRKRIRASYSGSYLDFIKSCEMILEIGDMKTCDDESVFDRCYELVSRTNQLNITGHKYSKDEFIKHTNILEKNHIYVRCGDKFGSYGIVGYISFDVKDNTVVIDEMAVSCRVAQKHVEYTILSWIARKYCEDGFMKIQFIQTGKNTPMFNCLKDVGFSQMDDGMKIESRTIADYDGIILMKDKLG